jgi:phosphate transport system substrate-binding protein
MKRWTCALAVVLATVPGLGAARADELPIVGTGDGIELLRAIGAAFTADHPETVILVPPSIGSGGGLAAIGSDKEVLARIARPLNDTEKSLGIIAEPVVLLPSAFYVNPSAGVTGVTSEQLLRIYRGDITNWKDLGGNDLRVKVVRREDRDSTLQVLRQSMPGWKDLVLTEKSKTATTTQESVDTVRTVDGAIGFGPFTIGLGDGLTVLRIDGRAPTDAGYPSAVVLALAYKKSTVTPAAQSFVSFAKGAKARTLLSSMGGVPAAE